MKWSLTLKFFLFCLALSSATILKAQQSVSIGTPNTNNNAILWLVGNGNQGLILPIIEGEPTTIQEDSDNQGMIVFSRATNKIHFYNGTGWVALPGSGGSGGDAYTVAFDGTTLDLLENGVAVSSSTILPANGSEGNILRWNGSAWEAGNIDINTALNNLSPQNNQVLTYIDGAGWIPATPTGGGTSLTAGTAIEIASEQISVLFDDTTIGVNNSNQLEIKDGAVGPTKIASPGTDGVIRVLGVAPDGTVQWYNRPAIGIDNQNLGTAAGSLTNSADITIERGSAVTIAGGTNVNVTQSAGTITIESTATGGGAIQTDGTTITGDGSGTSPLTVAAGGISTAEITDGTIAIADLSDMGATTTGQVLKWNQTNGNWEIGTDVSGGTPATDGTIITGDGSTGNEIRLANGTGAGQILQFDGTNWQIIADPDGDSDATNETITSFQVNGANLEITESGTTYTVALSDLGGNGDMLKADYDSNNDGIIDNADSLGGVPAGNYALQSDLPAAYTGAGNGDGLVPDPGASSNAFLRDDGTWVTPSGSGDMLTSTYDTNNNGLVDNADSLGGQLPSFYLDNTDAQEISLTTNTLGISGGTNTVDLSPYLDNTDAQELSLTTNTLGISGGTNTIDLSPYLDNTDNQTAGQVNITAIPDFSATTVQGALEEIVNDSILALRNALPGVYAGVGTQGLVPDPTTATGAFLRDDGTWVTPSGSGDMLTSTYDTDGNGLVDNADSLGSQIPSFYLDWTNFTNVPNVITDADTAVFAFDSDLNDYLLISDTAVFARDSDIAQFITASDTSLFAFDADIDGFISTSDTAAFAFDTDLNNYLLISDTTGLATDLDLARKLNISDTSVFARDSELITTASGLPFNQSLKGYLGATTTQGAIDEVTDTLVALRTEVNGITAPSAGTAIDITTNTINVKTDGTSITTATDALTIADDGVTASKINNDVAGVGLVQNGTSGALDVNVGTAAGNIVQLDGSARLPAVDGSQLTGITGEANTASNQGAAGAGVFVQKSGADLQFKNINAGSNKVTITDDAGNNEIDIDIDEANLSTVLKSANNLSDVANAATSRTNLGLGSMATLDSAFLNTISRAGAINGNVLRYDGTNWSPQDGVKWRTGSAVPSSATGINGDFFLLNTTGEVYEKVAGSWTSTGTYVGDKYLTTTTASYDITSNPASLAVTAGLAYSPGQTIIAAIDGSNYFTATVDSYSGTTLNISGHSVTGSGTGTLSVNLNGASAASSVSNLTDLGDANIASITDGDIMIATSGVFENKPITGDINLTTGGAVTVTRLQGQAVTTTNPSADGQILEWNTGSNQWEIGPGGITTLGGLTDASTTATPLADGQFMIYNSANTAFENKTLSGDGSLALDGTLTITGLQGNPVINTTPTTDGKILKWNQTNGRWEIGDDIGGTVTSDGTLTGDGSAGTPLAVNVGTTAGQIPQLDGSAKLPVSVETDPIWLADKATLQSTGTINNAGNIVDWTQLKSVPPGLADGTDDGLATISSDATLSGDGTGGSPLSVVGDLTDDQIASQVNFNNATRGYLQNVTGTTQSAVDEITDTLGVLRTDINAISSAANPTISQVLTNGNDAGDTQIKNIAAPTVAKDAANRVFVETIVNDTALAIRADLAQTLTETLTNGNDAGDTQIKNLADPTLAKDAANRQFVVGVVNDSSASLRADITQTLAQTLTNGNDAGDTQITNLAAPTLAKDAANRVFVETAVNDSAAAIRADISGFISAADTSAFAFDLDLARKLNISDTSVFARDVDIDNFISAADTSVFAFDNDLSNYLLISDTTGLATDLDLARKLNISDTSVFARDVDIDNFISAADTSVFAFDTDLTAANISHIPGYLTGTTSQAALDQVSDTLVTLRSALNATTDDQLAAEVPYDNTTYTFLGTNTQLAVDELADSVIVFSSRFNNFNLSNTSFDNTGLLWMPTNGQDAIAQLADSVTLFSTSVGSLGNLATLDSLPANLLQNSGASSGQILRWDAIGAEWVPSNNLTINGSGNINANVGIFQNGAVTPSITLGPTGNTVNLNSVNQTGSYNLTVPELAANDTFALKSDLPNAGWEVTGNTGLDSATNFIGTTDATPLRLRSNGTTGLILTSDGRAVFPSSTENGDSEARLSVAGPSRKTLSLSNSYSGSNSVFGIELRVDNGATGDKNGYVANIFGTAGSTSEIRAGNLITSQTDGAAIGINVLNSGGTGSTAESIGLRIINTSASSGIKYGIRSFDDSVNHFNGRMGLGIVAPEAKLDVLGDIRLGQITAPSTVTDKLYNVGGNLFWNGTNISSAPSWSLTGNTGLDSATNFIGTTDAIPVRFQTNGADRMIISSNGNVGIGTNTIGSLYTLVVNGRFKSAGIDEASDRRWKKNISTLEQPLAKVLALRGVSYNFRTEEFPEYNFTDNTEIGVIAQEVEEIVPELVTTDEKGYKSVNYSHAVALLIEAIKEQQKIIEKQQEEIAALKADKSSSAERIGKLEASMADMQKSLMELTNLVIDQQKQASNNK